MKCTILLTVLTLASMSAAHAGGSSHPTKSPTHSTGHTHGGTTPSTATSQSTSSAGQSQTQGQGQDQATTVTSSPHSRSTATGGTSAATGGTATVTANPSSASNSALEHSGNSASNSSNQNSNSTTTALQSSGTLTDETIVSSDTPRQTPPAYAGGVEPTASCKNARNGGASSPVAGISFGVSTADEECDLRETARLFWEMHQPSLAVRLLCQSKAAKRLFDCAPQPEAPPAGERERRMQERGFPGNK